MSAIESSLRLEIAQYQAQLAKARGEAIRFKEDLRRNSQDMGEAVMGRPESWHSVRANMTAFKLQMTRDGDEAGSAMGLALRNGLARYAGGAAIGAVVLGGIRSAVREAQATELTDIRLNVLVGDVSKARLLTGELKALGARTPLEFKDLAEAGSMLVAFGEEASKVPAVLTRIGDIASGVGAPLRDIAEIYGKARVQGTLFAEDINQLTGRGIPVIQEFARILGVTEGEVKKLASEGKVTFPLLEAAFKSLTNEGGKFASMMDQISKTGVGKQSTLSDELTQLSSIFGKPLARGWSDSVEYLTGKVAGLKQVFQTLNETAADGAARIQAARAAEEASASRKDPKVEAAEAEAKLRADFEELQASKTRDEEQKKAVKAGEEREKQAKAIADMRKEAERLSIAMLPDDQRLAALREQFRDLMDDAQFRSLGSGQRLDKSQGVEGLSKLADAHASDGNKTAEQAVLKQYKEALAIQKEIDDLQKSINDKRAAEGDKAAKEKEFAAQTRAVLDLENQIAREQAKTGQEENAKINAFRDELNVLQLTKQVQDQLKVGQQEALRIARERVATERAAIDAIKAQSQAEKVKQQVRQLTAITTQMQVDSLRAQGKDKEADKVERQARIKDEAARIKEATGFDAAKSEEMAKQHVQDQEKAQHRQDVAAWEAGGRVGPRPRNENRRGRDGSTKAKVSKYDQERASRVASGKSAWQALQDEPSDFDKLQSEKSDWQKLQEKQSAWQKLQDPMAGQQAANADKADQGPRGAEVEALLSKMLEALNRGFWG